MSKKEEIISSYYEKGLNIISISKNLKVSKQYVSKIIKKDSRYINEKNKRKQESATKQRQRSINWIKKSRELKKLQKESLDGFIKLQHFQASGELSGRCRINNIAFKKWNSSIYEYHNKTNEFRVKKDFENETSYAVPKKIKWK